MLVRSGFILPLTDILVFGVLVFFAVRGFMRGVLREIFGFLRIYFSFIVAALLYVKFGALLQNVFNTSDWITQMAAFIILFLVLLVVIWLLGTIVSKRMSRPETRNSLSRIGGIILGLAEGALIISAIIMVLNLYYISHSDQSPFEGSISYKVIEPIAPGIKKFAASFFSFLRR